MNNTNLRKSMIAIIMCVCLIMVLSLSYLFIVTNEEHHCTGKHCPICEQIQLAEHIIEQIKIAIKTVAVLISAIIFIYYSIKVVYIFDESNTPVKRKVRMND